MRKFSQAAWKRLGGIVKQERAKARPRLRQVDLARAMDMSIEVVAALEGAKRPVTVETLWKLEDALGWETDAAIKVLEGAPAPRRKPAEETPETVVVRGEVTPVEGDSMDLDTMLMSILDTWGSPAVMRSLARVLAQRKEKGVDDGPIV